MDFQNECLNGENQNCNWNKKWLTIKYRDGKNGDFWEILKKKFFHWLFIQVLVWSQLDFIRYNIDLLETKPSYLNQIIKELSVATVIKSWHPFPLKFCDNLLFNEWMWKLFSFFLVSHISLFLHSRKKNDVNEWLHIRYQILMNFRFDVSQGFKLYVESKLL
jgi:hypothetical protein